MANSIDGKWLYGKLKHGNDFKVVMKLYGNGPITNENLTGFLCEAIEKWQPNTKENAIEKAKTLIANHQLPLEIEDLPYHEIRFKIKIIKNGTEFKN